MSDLYNSHAIARSQAVYNIGISQDEYAINMAIQAIEDAMYYDLAEINKDVDKGKSFGKWFDAGSLTEEIAKANIDWNDYNIEDYLPKGYQVKYKHHDLAKAQTDVDRALMKLKYEYSANFGAGIYDTLAEWYKYDDWKDMPIASIIDRINEDK